MLNGILRAGSLSLRFILVVVASALGLFLVVLALSPQAAGFLHIGTSAEPEDINLDPLAQRSVVYDRYGNEIAVFHAEEDREEVPLDKVPEAVVRTILVVEDEDFYSHNGVNLKATFRALFENVAAGEIAQGGSTITQQLVKNALLTPAQDLNRKTKEAALAVRLEREMGKDEILERYLNTIYFGNGAYGVQAGAETYFNKNVEDLNWADAALLAALIRNPVGYDPIAYPDVAKERRSIVFDRLVETGDLTEEEAITLDATPLPEQVYEPVQPVQEILAGTEYFVEEVKQSLLDDPRMGTTPIERFNAVFKGGLEIHTTFDPLAQSAAEYGVREELPDTGGRFTAAVASVEPSNGAVRSMVGGTDFETEKFNLATQGKRQPGSSFKVFVLVTALEQGWIPSDTISGSSPCSIPNPGGEAYVAQNFGGSSGGTKSLTAQTTASSNCAYLRLGQVVGIDNVIDTARKLGLTTPLDKVPSMPLGSEEVIPLEMAAAYATLANDGIYNKPYYVERVADRHGNLLFEHEALGTRAVSTQTARLATQILEENVQNGTGTKAQIPGHFAAGKTGTAENFEDAWFVGYTEYLATAVWMGNKYEKIPMRSVGGVSVTGGSYPAEIWGAYMTEYHKLLPPVPFPPPAPTRSGKHISGSSSNDSSGYDSDSSDDYYYDDDYDDDDYYGGTTTTTGGFDEAPPPTDPPTTDPPTTDPPTTDPPAELPP
ncbi:MAG: Penicillin-binding protein 2D [Acidimicrobiales bacterium]|nr:Penicillin-binding protein 2D [Acidimicrobiales bacterium]